MTSFRKIAAHFGVTAAAVQNWEKVGFSRAWSLEEMEKWRSQHLENRIETDRITKWKAQLAKEELDEEDSDDTDDALPAAEGAVFENYNEARIAKIKREVERLDIKIKKERGELVLASEMREMAVKIISVWCSELDALVGDLPGQLAGLPEREIQPKLRSRIELLKANCKNGFAKL